MMHTEPRDPKGYTCLVDTVTGKMGLVPAIVPMPGDEDYHPKNINNYIKPQDTEPRDTQKHMHDRPLNPFIGPQGERCDTLEALRAAERQYDETFNTFIGPQGETCRTHEALQAAQDAYRATFMFKGPLGETCRDHAELAAAQKSYADHFFPKHEPVEVVCKLNLSHPSKDPKLMDIHPSKMVDHTPIKNMDDLR